MLMMLGSAVHGAWSNCAVADDVVPSSMGWGADADDAGPSRGRNSGRCHQLKRYAAPVKTLVMW